ncbi:MAG: sulfurtransferase [Candidatus Hydrogenedentes bacterium]|nr:sulfurtransferase [Candidatus Hydrogenedentota bacterium]
MVFAIITCVWGLTGPELLLSTEDAAKLNEVLFVDTRPSADYAAEHIAGVVHCDSAALSETRDGVKGMLRPIEQVKEMLSKAGVDPARHVVLYSAMEKPDQLKDATRLFWILDYLGYPRVSVLDGGLAKWKSEKRSIEAGGAKVEPVNLANLKLNSQRLADWEAVSRLVSDSSHALLDCRSPEEYSGAKKEDYVDRAGHIPGAVNVPATDYVEGDFNTVKAPSAIEEILGEKRISANQPAVTYCNTGRSASVGYFMLRWLGRENVALYDGSMAEWSKKPNLDVE